MVHRPTGKLSLSISRGMGMESKRGPGERSNLLSRINSLQEAPLNRSDKKHGTPTIKCSKIEQRKQRKTKKPSYIWGRINKAYGSLTYSPHTQDAPNFPSNTNYKRLHLKEEIGFGIRQRTLELNSRID
ncbi:hypothetical protein M9H77_30239 [Catharanthus roseus]|uniref:Uncharacterized protein n=1 Tax=Catharanthus roseus TaxID=4058 RepID=A0ACB9ZWP9_CATRO|nr:hypothetical protein M9H77_30239 [Catharanthus roseus]